MTKLILIIIGFLGLFTLSCNRISIVNDTYENRPHYKIETQTATYYYDKAGGGFSRVIDSDGVDWVQYNGDPHAQAPSGASGGFRGIPNLVFRSEDAGAGHPGFDQCNSEKINERSIRTQTKSGKWQWCWKFYDDHARVTIEKIDSNQAYWFLYEGTVAGKFEPKQQYWGTDLGGPRYDKPSLNHGERILGKWQWAYFGDKGINRIFFVAQEQKDKLTDHFAYMGDTEEGTDASNGMVVFGFGREEGAKPLMTKTDDTFMIGFLNRRITSEEDHEWVNKELNEIINKQ